MHKFLRTIIYLGIFLGLSLSTHLTYADTSSLLRLGIGASTLDFKHASKGIPDGKTVGSVIFAEYAQDNYSATRLMFYRTDSNSTRLYGGETQLLLGYGLATDGIRIYTGPTWHLEHLHIPQIELSESFHGFGWQLGLGWQYRSIAFDYSAAIRDNRRYKSHFKAYGADSSVYQHNLLLSYKF